MAAWRPGWRSIDYDTHGAGYAALRRPDPVIAARIEAALGDARTVVNVGAGTGSYEPADRHVIAIEPSATMRRQRPAHLSPAIDARAESLPLDDDSVDAAMAVLTVHHWEDPRRGLGELRRVARGPIVVATLDIDALVGFWLLRDYLPEALADERRRFGPIDAVVDALGGARVEPVTIGTSCTDGFVESYYARPERLLDPLVRGAQSVWPRLPVGVEQRVVEHLAADLASGAWDARNPGLRTAPSYASSLRLVVSRA